MAVCCVFVMRDRSKEDNPKNRSRLSRFLGLDLFIYLSSLFSSFLVVFSSAFYFPTFQLFTCFREINNCITLKIVFFSL